MNTTQTLSGLLQQIAERGSHPAVVFVSDDAVTEWDCATLAAQSRSLALGLRTRHGVASGDAVAIHAPNGPLWVMAALAILAAGAVLVPLDDLSDTSRVLPLLDASRARLLFTTRAHLTNDDAALRQAQIRCILLEPAPADATDQGLQSWDDLLAAEAGDLPVAAPGDPAALLATSGTTGTPKTFLLTHRNIGSNVRAVCELGIIDADDRVLLPLPLHHAYPLVIGMLTPLTVGSTLVLPSAATGPAIMRAARLGGVTVMVGVPRLYEAIAGAIETRIAARSWLVRLAIRALLRVCTDIHRTTRLPLGRWVFRRVRRSVVPSLRLMVSGGAHLEAATSQLLEAIGWMVLPGYGLAETASIFTGNRPRTRRVGSAGPPIGDGQIRIVEPDSQGVGEIQLRGESITDGYLDNPEANQATFTPDGWFRTGDLGYLDRDGFLYVTGRAKEVLVLGGGKKVSPEDLERVYSTAPQIQEIAVLEEDGALVALVRPDEAGLRAMGATNIRDGVRVVLAERGRDLPSYQRLSGFALTNEPLPRTRLGKYRRFLLPELYTRALAGQPARAPHPPTPEDSALLADPTVAAIWALLQARQPERALDLDMSPALDLNFDSFAWMELTVALQERFGVRVTEADIAGIHQIRDLLRLASMRHAGAATPAKRGLQEAPIATDIDRWLAPTGSLLTAAGLLIYLLNLAVMRGCFRLRVRGLEHLPQRGPFVITPNHVSDLDAMAIAAALPLPKLKRLYWAGDIVRLFHNAASRLFCRVVHLFPVDEKHPSAAVTAAERVLATGNAQVWFPEGWRSPDGRLQRFQIGIGQLLLRTGVPAVPAYIDGAFAALPRGRRIPQFRQITLVLGAPVTAEVLLREASGKSAEERVAAALRARVFQVADTAGFAVEAVQCPGSVGQQVK